MKNHDDDRRSVRACDPRDGWAVLALWVMVIGAGVIGAVAMTIQEIAR